MVEVHEEVMRLLEAQVAGAASRSRLPLGFEVPVDPRDLEAPDGTVAPDGAQRLFLLVYDQLRARAHGLMRGERNDHTLEATAVVHEVYLRLVDERRVAWQGRTHFLAVASRAMRRFLIEHARSRECLKRGGGAGRLTLHDGMLAVQPRELDALVLEEALASLSDHDPRKARVVEMRFFAGMSNDEIGVELGVTPRTVERDWLFSRAWLLAAMRTSISTDDAMGSTPLQSRSPPSDLG